MRKQSTNSDSARLSHLRAILDSRNGGGDEATIPIPDRLLAEIEQIVPIYEGSIRQRARVTSRRKARKKHLAVTSGRLGRLIRTVWWVILNRVGEGTVEETELHRYGFTQTGKRPRPTEPRDWVTIGNQILTTDRGALKPLSEPDATDLAGAIEAVEAAILEVHNTDLALEAAKQATWSARAEAKDLLRQVSLTLELELRKMEPIRKRQHLRALGFRYESSTETEPTVPIESETKPT